MPIQNSQAFNDGLCSVYEVTNIAKPGAKPQEGLELRGKLRYAERTVGMNRYTNFLQNDVEVARVLRMPRKFGVSTQDVAIPNDGHQYRVVQVQYPQDVYPKCMDLSLERIEQKYAEP